MLNPLNLIMFSIFPYSCRILRDAAQILRWFYYHSEVQIVIYKPLHENATGLVKI